MTVASIESDEIAAHRLELEVHASGARLHVAAGDERAVVAPDDAAQGMQRGVGPHQGKAARPVEVDLELVADRRWLVLAGLELVDDLAAGLPRAPDRPRAPVGCADDDAAIGRLAAAARVEDRAIQDQERGLARLDVADPCHGRPGIGVGVAELFAALGHERGAITAP